MSVNVKFYTNNSDRRVPVKDLTEISSKDCELKGDCSITGPVLIVTGDAATYSLCNYFYIAAFHRYYYAEVTSLPGGLMQISGKVDVLSSAWPYIKDLDAVLDRQQENFNLYLNDGTFKAYANDQVVTKEFSSGFSSPSYVLIVAG